ncbi:Glycine betaine methyltransferase [subsurface metagenome]
MRLFTKEDNIFPGRDFIIFCPNISAWEVYDFYPRSTKHFKKWEPLVEYLQRNHGAHTRAFVFPCGPLQLERKIKQWKQGRKKRRIEKMKAILNFLSQDEVEHIHEASLRILKETGVKIYSEKVRKLLADNGAEVTDSVVKIPSSLVERAVKDAPKEFTLAARDPQCDLALPLPRDFPYLSTGGFDPFVRDFETGERRYASSADLRNFAVLSDYLDIVDYFWPIVIPSDIPPPLQELHSLAIAFESNRKHIQCSSVTEKTAKWQIELASTIVGNKDKLKYRPLFSTINCPIAPLSFEKGSSEAMVTLSTAGIPIAPMTMVLSGASGPATMAGTLAVANAEELASLVIVECANPGAPIIYCAEITPVDMRSGEINYAAPEYPLLVTGCTQMAKFYRLPSRDCPTRNDLPEEISSELSSIKSLLEVPLELMSRPDLGGSVGDDKDYTALTGSLVEVILDCEAHAHGRAYLHSFEISDDTLALDVINQVGPGGNFLGERHSILKRKSGEGNPPTLSSLILG